jgi:hypothetical protein
MTKAPAVVRVVQSADGTWRVERPSGKIIAEGLSHSRAWSIRVDIAIGTNNFRAVRGRAVLAAILDECAFYQGRTRSRSDNRGRKTPRARRDG